MQDNRYSGMGFGSTNNSEAKWDANIPWYDLKPAVWNQLRVVGPIYIVAQNWFTTPKGKKFALFSRAWDPFTRSYDKQDQDPIFTIFGNPYDSTDEKIKGIAPRQTAFVEAFVRPTVGLANGGELKPLRLPISVINGIRKIMDLNFVLNPDGTVFVDEAGKPVVADPTDQNHGYDVMVFYDPSKQGSDKYTIQSGPRSRLVEGEITQTNSLRDWSNIIKVPTENQVKEALSKNGYMSLANNSFGQMSEIGSSSSGQVVAPPAFAAAPAPMAAPMAPVTPPAPAYVAPTQGFNAPAAPVPMAPMAPPAPTAFAAPAAPMAPPAPMAPNPK